MLSKTYFMFIFDENNIGANVFVANSIVERLIKDEYTCKRNI